MVVRVVTGLISTVGAVALQLCFLLTPPALTSLPPLLPP